MTSFDSNRELLKLLEKQLDTSDKLIENWLGRPRKSKDSDTPEPLDQLAYLSQIEALSLIKRYMKTVSKDINLRPIERIIDAYWDAYHGARPILFSSPLEKKGGKPTKRKSNEHLAPLAAAVAVLKKFQLETTYDISKYVAQLSMLDADRVRQIYKEFAEGRKSESAQTVYHLLQDKVISGEYQNSDEFLTAVRGLVELYKHFSLKGN
ncbi:hypothetical protein OAN71_00590 [bacterium]|jgi:hypothetical protein|nr:hypothetical protein [bacterium]